jgi:hypothetical protein
MNTLYPKQEVLQLKTGNLALPNSQQPAPVFAFGQNGTDKGDLQAFFYFDQDKGDRQNFIECIPSILYGITDDLSLFITSSIFLYHKLNNKKGSLGIQNISPQLEYSVYERKTPTFTDKATIVGNISFPTRSIPLGPLLPKDPTALESPKNPTTGVQSPSFFLGATVSRTETKWYLWMSPGALLTCKATNGTKVGNQYFVQGGISHNIPSSSKFILLGGIEIDGIFSVHDKIFGTRDANSGGQLIYLGPTFWFSSQYVILQAGIAAPIYQHLNGIQNKNWYLAAIDFGVKF